MIGHVRVGSPKGKAHQATLRPDFLNPLRVHAIYGNTDHPIAHGKLCPKGPLGSSSGGLPALDCLQHPARAVTNPDLEVFVNGAKKGDAVICSWVDNTGATDKADFKVA